MSSNIKLQIEPLCKHHSLPFAYICITKYCHCQIKLCEKCHTQHEAENQNSNLMKIQNFANKIETQVQILNKQHEKLLASSPKTTTQLLKQSQIKVQKFLFNQVNIMENSMKYLNQESRKVIIELKDSSDVLLSKMANIQLKRKDFPQKFCRKIIDQKLIDTMITFYNQEGFANFRKKLDKSLKFRGILKDFLLEADKYGRKYEQFMKSSSKTVSSNLSMKSSMIELLRLKKEILDAENDDPLQFRKPAGRQNNFIKDEHIRREKRSKTIFRKN